MRQSARPRNPWLIAAVLAFASTVAAGCDEEGFIVTTGGSPVITSLEVPAQVNAGGAFLVNVGAISRRGVAEIEVRLSGAYTDTSRFEFDPVRLDTVPVSFTVTVPDTVTGLLIRVEAVATDAQGRVSRPVSRNVNVVNQGALSAADPSAGARVMVPEAVRGKFAVSTPQPEPPQPMRGRPPRPRAG